MATTAKTARLLKVGIAGLAACAAFTLPGCASGGDSNGGAAGAGPTPSARADADPDAEQIAGRQWHAVGIYTSPDSPARVPKEVTEQPTLVLGDATAVGSTGCARFSARVSYFDGEEPARVEDANIVRIDDIRYADEGTQGDDCTGASAWADNNIRNMFHSGAEFALELDPNGELRLTLRNGEIDSPVIRFAGL